MIIQRSLLSAGAQAFWYAFVVEHVQRAVFRRRRASLKIHTFKISKAALDARKDLDGQDCIDVPEEATLNRLGLTIADVTVGWSFAEITFDIQQVCPAEGCWNCSMRNLRAKWWYQKKDVIAFPIPDQTNCASSRPFAREPGMLSCGEWTESCFLAYEFFEGKGQIRCFTEPQKSQHRSVLQIAAEIVVNKVAAILFDHLQNCLSMSWPCVSQVFWLLDLRSHLESCRSLLCCDFNHFAEFVFFFYGMRCSARSIRTKANNYNCQVCPCDAINSIWSKRRRIERRKMMMIMGAQNTLRGWVSLDAFHTGPGLVTTLC